LRFETVEAVAVNWAGNVIVSAALAEQPLLSLTVMVYVPAPRLDAVRVVPPTGAHK
jgi:hypothetical protein